LSKLFRCYESFLCDKKWTKIR